MSKREIRFSTPRNSSPDANVEMHFWLNDLMGDYIAVRAETVEEAHDLGWAVLKREECRRVEEVFPIQIGVDDVEDVIGLDLPSDICTECWHDGANHQADACPKCPPPKREHTLKRSDFEPMNVQAEAWYAEAQP